MLLPNSNMKFYENATPNPLIIFVTSTEFYQMVVTNAYLPYTDNKWPMNRVLKIKY